MTDRSRLKTALIQLSVGDDPAANLPVTQALIRQAASQGAKLILTPEATNLLGASAEWQQRHLVTEAHDPTLAALRAQAGELGVWLLIGSLSLATGDPNDPRLANRSFLIAPDGRIAARYDKLHKFDVTISDSESYRESNAFRPGDRVVLAQGPVPVGMTICYDLRFAGLYRRLAQAGARILTVPAAFNDTTGAAHWEVLLRARAIETGCYVLAPAQTGDHPRTEGKPRATWGHSLAVAPWGEVLVDAGTEPGVSLIDLDMAEVSRARTRVPALAHDRAFASPQGGAA